MKIVLLYLRIIKKSDPNYVEPKSYNDSSKRFLSSYLEYKPKIDHELVVVNCGSEQHDGMFDGVASRYETDFGGGFDCGSFRHVGAKQNCDLVVGLNTHTYFWRDRWLDPIAHCALMNGPGVYGVGGSYEQNPHLRTPCIAFSPKVISQYPHPVETRLHAGEFEFGPNNFSLWAISRNFPCKLVTPTTTYGMSQWRKTKNGFRQGDQSECLVFDRHTEIYDQADNVTKTMLERAANGTRR